MNDPWPIPEGDPMEEELQNRFPRPNKADALARAQEALQRRPLDFATLVSREPPDREWAIDHWLGMDHVTLLAGSGGLGKTRLAQQLGSALALGQSFIDRVERPRTVLMWATEDDDAELWRRQVAIARDMNVSLDAFADRLIVHSYEGRDCVLGRSESGQLVVTSMLEELRSQVFDYEADVVILDNVSTMFEGKEIERQQVTRFVRSIRAATRERRAAVLLLGHTARASGSEYAGSAAWENAVRSRWWLTDTQPDRAAEREEASTDGVVYLAKRKANYSARDVREMRFEEGVFRFTAAPEEAGGMFVHIRQTRAKRVVLEALRKLVALGQMPSDGSNSPSFLPKLALEYKLGEGHTKRDLADAMRALMVDGTLRREQVGVYPSNRSPRFGLVEA